MASENGFTLAYLKWFSYFGSCLRWMERKSATEMPDSNSGQGSANASPKKQVPILLVGGSTPSWHAIYVNKIKYL